MNEATNYNTVGKASIRVKLSGRNAWKRIRRRLTEAQEFVVFYRPSSPSYRWVPIFRARFCQRIPFSVRKQWRSRQISDTEIRFMPAEREKNNTEANQPRIGRRT